MNILISGGTGFVGRVVVKKLLEKNHKVYVLSRSMDKVREVFGDTCEFVLWPSYKDLPDLSKIEKIDAVLNLSGENIGKGRWTNQLKKEIYNSRVDGTKNLIKALSNAGHKVETFISTSAIGVYGSQRGVVFTESSSHGEGFLAKVCSAWEEAAQEAKKICDRLVVLRVGIVLGKGGGAMEKMLPLFKLGLGGVQGDGQHYMSWIHLQDVARSYVLAVENKNVEGVYNCVAEFAVTNQEFTNNLAAIVRKPAFFKSPAFMIKAAVGEMSTMILQDAHVKADRLKQLKFHYLYPTIQLALKEVVSKEDSL